MRDKNGNFIQMKDDNQRVCYLAKDKRVNLYKVGYTRDMYNRMSTLNMNLIFLIKFYPDLQRISCYAGVKKTLHHYDAIDCEAHIKNILNEINGSRSEYMTKKQFNKLFNILKLSCLFKIEQCDMKGWKDKYGNY